MLLYILVATFPLLIGALYDSKVEKFATVDVIGTKKYIRVRWWWLFFAALPMFALIALRGPSMGADTSVYLKFFKQMQNTAWSEIFVKNDQSYKFEEGFVVFEKLATCITKNAKVYQVLYSSIYGFAVVGFANRMKKNPFMFLFFVATLGIYTFMFTGVRQCLAMSICLFSYRFVQERHLIPFLLLVALAYFFHYSALMFLIVYFIYNWKINATYGILYIFLMIVVFATRNLWQEWFMENYEYNTQQSAEGTGTIYFAVVLLITVFSVIMIISCNKLTPEIGGYINGSFIALMFWLLRLTTMAAERPSYYFLFFTVAMLSYGVESLNDEKQKTATKALICILCLALFMYRFTSNFASLVPYQSFF